MVFWKVLWGRWLGNIYWYCCASKFYLGGGFKYIYIYRFVIFTPFREDSHFDSYFSNGLVQPPTSPILASARVREFFSTSKGCSWRCQRACGATGPGDLGQDEKNGSVEGVSVWKRQIQYGKRSKYGGKVDDFHSISLMLNPLPLHEIASFWTNHFNDAFNKIQRLKMVRKKRPGIGGWTWLRPQRIGRTDYLGRGHHGVKICGSLWLKESGRVGGYVWKLIILGLTLQGINISHLGKRNIIFKMPFFWDMLTSRRVGVPWCTFLGPTQFSYF